MSPIVIAGRFRGPEGSANGGYFAGCVAVRAGRTVTVRLLRPPPLDTPLDAVELADGTLAIKVGDGELGEAKSATLELVLRSTRRLFRGSGSFAPLRRIQAPSLPTCFVCGTQRSRGDGMGSSPARSRRAATSWPRPGFPMRRSTGSHGKVRPEFMSAALDCPGFYAARQDVA